MADDQEQTAIRTLLQENQRLKKRLFDLEEKIRKGAPPSEGQSGSGSSVLKLIEHKDFQLEQCTARLEEKKEQLEDARRELENLRFYQEVFENEARATIGVNRDGVVIVVNRAASKLFGEKLKESLKKPIESVDFRHADPDTAKRVRQALTSRKRVDSSVSLPDYRVQTWVEPIESESEVRGALLHILAISTK